MDSPVQPEANEGVETAEDGIEAVQHEGPAVHIALQHRYVVGMAGCNDALSEGTQAECEQPNNYSKLVIGINLVLLSATSLSCLRVLE